MQTVDIKKVIKELVSQLMRDKKIFTAFDVTKILRKECGTILTEVKHYEVREEIQNLYMNDAIFDGYKRVNSSINVNGNIVDVLLYGDAFIVASLGNVYNPSWVEDEDYYLILDATLTGIPGNQNKCDDDDDDELDNCEDEEDEDDGVIDLILTLDHRLNIPVNIIKAMGLSHNNKFVIYSSYDNSVYFDVYGDDFWEAQNNDDVNEYIIYNVDIDNRVRVSESVLERLFETSICGTEYFRASPRNEFGDNVYELEIV